MKFMRQSNKAHNGVGGLPLFANVLYSLVTLLSRCALISILISNCAVGNRLPESQLVPEERIFNFPYRMETLNNGLKVIVVKTDYPGLISLQIPMQVGSRNETEKGKSGFSHFFEHLMFKGSKNYPQNKYAMMVKSFGVDGNAYSYDDWTNYSMSFPVENLQNVLILEADRFQNLLYTEEAFRTEALAIKGEYYKNSYYPYNKLYEVARSIAFNDHSYKHPVMGLLSDIDEMPNQFDYSKEFFKRWYVPQFASVIVVGDVDVDQTVDWIKKYWSAWSGQENNIVVPVEKPQDKQLYQHVKFENPNAYMTMAFRGPALDEDKKDKPALDLISEAYFSKSSDLYKDLVVDRQMVQSIYPYFPNTKDPQLFYISVQLKDEKYANEVKTAIVNTLVKARTERLDDGYLNNIKNNLKYSFAHTLDSNNNIAQVLAKYVHFKRDPEFLNRLYRTFGSTTAEDVRQYASKYFIDDNLTIVTLSPNSTLKGFNPSVALDAPSRALAYKNISKNKIQTLLMPTESNLIDIIWWFNTGAAQDPKDKKGLSTLMSMMLANAGSASRTYSEIQKAMYPLAGRLSASVDKEMFVIRGSVHRDNLAKWYALVSEQLLQPGWSVDDFKRLKGGLINHIESNLRSNNDEELAKEVLYEALYRDHSYEALNAGNIDDLNRLTLDDLRGFYQQNITQNNLILAIAGNYPEAFKNKIIKDMGNLPIGDKVQSRIVSKPKLEGRHVTIVEKNTRSIAVSFGFPIDVKRGDEDWIALWLVRSWLGEHRKASSHLFQRIREARGMNYGAYAYIEYFPAGMFMTKPMLNVSRLQQIFQVWIRPLRTANDAHFATRIAVWEMQKLIKNGLTEEQFESTKNYLYNYVLQLADSQSRILASSVDSMFYGTEELIDYVRNGLDSLTLKQVNKAIAKHLQLDNIHFVFITKDAKDMKERLVNNSESFMVYNDKKSEQVIREDEIISRYPLKIKPSNIKIEMIDAVFE